MSITENDEGQPQLEIIVHRGGSLPRVLKMTLPPAHPEPSVSPLDAADGRVPCACCRLYVCEITETEVCPGEQPLPPFDSSVERIAQPNESLSDAIASGKVEVSRESVSIEEVIAKIEALQKEALDEH